MKFRLKYVFIFLITAFVISLIIDLIRINSYDFNKSLPKEKLNSEINNIYYELGNGVTEIDWARLNTTLDYIDHQFDVSDFRMATIVRVLYEFSDQIPDSIKSRIEKTLFNFRYWMDEPGGNGMCYWSENHQILFASSEYLIAQMYPDSLFINSGLNGKQHMKKAQIRILDWLEMKWNYGFTEFYSNVYYSEDIGGMINLIDFSNDKEIATKTATIMDLMIYDVATQKTGDMFLSVSGRAYEKNRKGGPKTSFKNIVNHIWNPEIPSKAHLNYGFITSGKYKTPSVLIDIGNDSNPVIIKQSNGLNISELKTEGYFGSDERSMMMQWGMEAFTNKEIIRNSLNYIRRNNLFTNEFLHPFKDLDFTALRIFHLEPIISYILSPQTDGVAIQRGNTYTYRTKDYSIYSVQEYFPGMNADQHHVTGMNLGNSFSVFHTHPALADTVKFHSPNYWVGYGRLPHVGQEKNISLSIYNIPEKKNILEMDMLHFTHAYFPTELFDSVLIQKNYAFGKKDSTYCALIGRNDLYLKGNKSDDIIQDGQKVYWIVEAGSYEEDASFNNFYKRILNNKINFDTELLLLEYTSRNDHITLEFNDTMKINGEVITTEYDRYNSPYIKAKRKSNTLRFKLNDKFLNLDFQNQIREFN